jgi:hypothetical protein
MIRTIKALGFLLLIVVATACTNLFENFSNTASDQALLDAAQAYNDQKNFDLALVEFSQMSSSYQTRRDVLALWASSYAGRAGLDFVTLAKNVKNIGSTNLMLFLMQNFDSGSASKIADMWAAQNKMLQISTTTTTMSNAELLELALISMGYMGSTISTYEDVNADGTPDNTTAVGVANHDVCSVFPSFGSSPDVISQFVVSLNWLQAAVTQLSTNGLSFGSASMTGAQAACTYLTTHGLGTYAFCGITDSTTVTGTQYKGVLSVMNEATSGIGLGHPCTGDISTCACP